VYTTGVSTNASMCVVAAPSGQGVHATSSESGSIRGGMAGVGPTGMVSVATSPFGGVTAGSDSA
jgi:hypothetical protein